MESWRRTDYVSDEAWLDRAAAALSERFDHPDGAFTPDCELNHRRLGLDALDIKEMFEAIDPEDALDYEALPADAHFPASVFEPVLPILLGLVFALLGPLVFFFAPEADNRWISAVLGVMGALGLIWGLMRMSQILKSRRLMAEQGYSGFRRHPLTLRDLLKYRRTG
jgi:hypothetical protein